ncbi:hypothetical protein LCGC14_2405700 [marine sediment metagenome]|uniref:Uncharacterized protein n=1 Tax=marine sediment metagenome TaxID=412755 RepID=A0A0F9BTZ4_9ZZZZ
MKHDKLSYIILGLHREYFIKMVKLPLRKVLILMGKRIPDITKENTEYNGTHALIDIFEKLSLYTDVKQSMFRGAEKIFLMEMEHDGFYRNYFLLFIEEIIKKILAGEFPARRDENPLRPHWNTITPKGGKYSIISILQDKKGMENLLGDKWIYKG